MTTTYPHLFPTPIMIDDSENHQLCDFLNSLAYSIEQSDINFDKNEYPCGYTSYFTDQNLQTLPELREFCQFLIDKSKLLYNHCGYRTDEVPIAITSLWVSIQRKGSQHGIHNHRMSMFSGTYYSKADEKSANIMFQTPLEFHKMHMPIPKPPRPGHEDDYYVQPKSGRTVIFPGYLNHRVMPQTDDSDRIAWSFNTNYFNFFK